MNIILLILLSIIIGCFLLILLNIADTKVKEHSIIKKEDLIIKSICFLIPSIFLIIFVFRNYQTSGNLFSQLFYKLESDFSMDFHVFFSESVLYKECYIDNTEGFNPPLIKIVSLFLYRSFPRAYQDIYAEGAVDNPILDIRLLVQAALPFMIFVSLALVMLALIIYHYKKGSVFEKCYYIFLTLANIGVIFAIERGNYILLALPFAFFFVATYQHENKYIRELGLLALGISAGLKVYPCLLGILLLKDKRWRAALHAILYGIIFVFGPFIYYGGIHGILGFFSSLHGTGEPALRIGTLNITSFFYTMSRILNAINIDVSPQVHGFKIFSYILFGLGIMCVFFYKEMWKATIMLVTLIILYAGTAHTYMLSLLIIPLYLFLNDKKEKKLVNYFYTIIFVILSSLIVLPMGDFLKSIRLESERFTTLMILQQFTIVLLFVLLLSEGMVAILQYGCFKLKAKKINS